MDIEKLTPKLICEALDGTCIASVYGVELYYHHTPRGRGYFMVDSNEKAHGKYLGAEMREASREFNKQVMFAVEKYRLFVT